MNNQKADARLVDGVYVFGVLGLAFGVLAGVAAYVARKDEFAKETSVIGDSICIALLGLLVGFLTAVILFLFVSLPVVLFAQDWFDCFPRWVATRRAKGLGKDSRSKLILVSVVVVLSLGAVAVNAFRDPSEIPVGLFKGKLRTH